MNRSSNPVKHYASAIYEVNAAAAVDLGTLAEHTPLQTSIIPDNAIITDIAVETLTASAPGTSTILVKAGNVAITAAMTQGNMSATVPYITVLPKKATSAAAITFTPATAIVTAVKLNVIVGYFLSGE
jgi:hypothetical protein|tara:strand:+ start:103 stop:486 length:384 start_codon:yes stop_codon:yes gene_type:complete